MKRRSDFIFELARLASDMLMINIAFLFSYWLRFNTGILPVPLGTPGIAEYINPLPIITVILLFIMRSFNLYMSRRRLAILDEFFLIVKAMTIGLLVLMSATFIYREFTYSRLMLIICWADLIIFISLARFAINRVRFFIRSANKDFSRLIVVGTGPVAHNLISHINDDPHWNYKVIGAISIKEEKDPTPLKSTPVLGDLSDIAGILSKTDADEVILTVPSIDREKITGLIFECEKRMMDFHLVADILGMITSQVDMENVDGIPLMGLKKSPLEFIYNRFIKRCIDIIVSAAGIMLLLPVIIIISLAIKISSMGPVFYLQKRVGEDRRRFAIIKFRTMIYKAEKKTGAVWAKKNDPRKTAIGSFLRRHNLDELPQLFNVLKGEMSLVGPRPERPKFVGRFKEDIPRYMARHRIKSGITGWAQVNGLRGDTSIEERTRYDLYYMENWSLMLDIKILLMSVFQTLFTKSENAY
jgi:Undecaprenyl-phosphate glucose phosphotransferase